MQRVKTIQIDGFQFEICDLKNAAIITLSCAIATLFSWWWVSPQGIFAVVIVPFLLYSKVGSLPKTRTLSLIPMGLASALCVGLTTICNIGLWMILPWFLIITFILYLLPRYIPGSQLAGIFILVFVLLAYSMPVIHWIDVWQRMLAVLIGTLIIVCVNLLFDYDIHVSALPNPDKSLLLIQRALRMSITMTFLIFLCHDLAIQNAAWVGFSLIAVEQNNLGASLKKAAQRIAGTILGIILGLILSHFLFIPYPSSRMLSLILVFGLFASLRYNYTFAIVLGTILLADLFYFISSAQTSIEMFLWNRILDTLLGIIIGLASAQIIFPRSLLSNLKQELSRFWTTHLLFLKMAELNKFDDQLLVDLDNIVLKLNLDIKDFRYEPISFLFRRYHLTIKLIALLKKLLTNIKYLHFAPKELPSDVLNTYLMNPLLASVQLISDHHKSGRPITDHQPFHEMDQQVTSALEHLNDYPEAKEILVAMHQILKIYQKIAMTQRWSLEIT